MNKLITVFGLVLLWAAGAMAQNPIYVDGFENHPDAVEILAFTADPVLVFEGEDSTLSWQLKDATSCTATDGTAQWRAQVIDGSDSSFDVTNLTTVGINVFTLTCIGPVGDPAVASTNILVEVPPPVGILSFTAVPSTINAGDIVTLSWTLENAIDCTPTSGSAQWLALSLDGSDNSVEITDVNIVGVYDFGLSCEGVSGDTTNASQDVTVEAVVSNCDAPTLTGQNFLWADFWQSNPGVEFPDVGLTRQTVVIFSKGYISIEFNTGDASAWGQFGSVNNTFSSGLRLGSVSECPGEFDVHPKCKATWGIGGGIRWATDGHPSSCDLEQNTTYFLNMTYTDGSDPQSTNCVIASGLSSCWITVDYQKGN